MAHESQSIPVVALVSDLMFQSKITAGARAEGLAVRFARTMPELLAAIDETSPKLALVDLGAAGHDLTALVDRARANGRVQTVGFGSHVDAAALDRAVEAGLDEVMPRSQFEQQLMPLLAAAQS